MPHTSARRCAHSRTHSCPLKMYCHTRGSYCSLVEGRKAYKARAKYQCLTMLEATSAPSQRLLTSR